MAMAKSRNVLLESAQHGNVTKVKEIISVEKHLVNCQDSDLRTPLLLAAWNNHLEIVKYLIEQGAEVDKAAYDKMTPLMAAASYGWGETVSWLLEHKANIDNVSRSGKTALIYAALGDPDTEKAVRYDDCVKRLIRSGANLNIRDRDGKTAIMHARSNSITFDALIEAKADLELKDERGRTVFTSALLEEDSLSKISKLRDQGVDINHVDHDGNSAFDLVLKSKELMNEKIEILLSSKTPTLDPRFKDKALTKVIESKSSFSSRAEWKREEVVDYDGQSLLTRAIQDEKYSVAIALIPFCDINQKITGKSPLEIALEKNQINLAERLIEAGADMNAVANTGEPLLIRFIRNKTIAPFLVRKGSNVDIELKDGSTPLIKAVEEYHEELVNLILQRKPKNLNAKNRDERTALFIATLESISEPARYSNIIAALIKAEADPFVVCKNHMINLTVFDIAYNHAKEMLSAYRTRLGEKTSIVPLIERGGHPLYRGTASAGGATLNVNSPLNVFKFN